MAGAFSGHLLHGYENPSNTNFMSTSFPQIKTEGCIQFDPSMHGTVLPEYSYANAGIQQKLDQQLGPEYLSTRAGGGGKKFTYVEGWKMINLANETFGFDGWSSNVVSVTTDFIDLDNITKKYHICATAIVRVTLGPRWGNTWHEDSGLGMMDNAPNKAAAIDKCKKEAVTDALKRALRQFGNLMGNCLYDKNYLTQVSKMKCPPTRFDQSALHRHPSFANTNIPPQDTKPIVPVDQKPPIPQQQARPPQPQHKPAPPPSTLAPPISKPAAPPVKLIPPVKHTQPVKPAPTPPAQSKPAPQAVPPRQGSPPPRASTSTTVIVQEDYDNLDFDDDDLLFPDDDDITTPMHDEGEARARSPTPPDEGDGSILGEPPNIPARHAPQPAPQPAPPPTPAQAIQRRPSEVTDEERERRRAKWMQSIKSTGAKTESAGDDGDRSVAGVRFADVKTPQRRADVPTGGFNTMSGIPAKRSVDGQARKAGPGMGLMNVPSSTRPPLGALPVDGDGGLHKRIRR